MINTQTLMELNMKGTDEVNHPLPQSDTLGSNQTIMIVIEVNVLMQIGRLDTASQKGHVAITAQALAAHIMVSTVLLVFIH